jgi:subtilisin family serine protease
MDRSRRRGGAFASAAILVALLAAIAAPASTLAAPPAGAAAPEGPAGGPEAGRVKALVTFHAPPGRAAEGAIAAASGSVRFRFSIIPTLAVEVPAAALDGLRRNPLVAAVELDHRIEAFDHVTVDTGDLEYENAWGVEHIGTKSAHDANVRGQGVRVAVIDTGIDYIHDDPDNVPYVVDPEFNSNYRGGYDFVNNDADPMDDNGHGTHVAGILAAEKNGYLVVGVAPAVELYALKVLGPTGEGDYSGLIAALNWAVVNDMDVVNISLGGHEVSAALQAAVEAAAAAGVLMAAASGNTVTIWELLYGCPVAYPAAYPQVLSTTFTNPSDALTGFSCTGPEVDYAAPGDQIFSPVPVGTCMFCSQYGYSPQSGTSMASPHLAGTIALLLSAGLPDTGSAGLVDDVRDRICATADTGFGVLTTPIPTTDPRYPKYFGCGVINAGAAVAGLVPPPPGNDPPVAGDDTLTTAEDTPADVDVLANDSDPDADTLVVTALTDPANGTASINPDGTVRYVPDPDFHGSDGFDYTASDGNGGTALGAVSVTVDPANDDPTATDDAASVAEDAAVTIDVLANDGDVDGDLLSVLVSSGPSSGTAVVQADGRITYTPSPNFAGADSFDYAVSDGAGGTAGASVSITVTPVNDAPVAVNDSTSTAYQTAVTIPVLANDGDVDGGPLSVILVTSPVNGAAVTNPDETVTYTPTAGFSGVDAFTYTVSDGAGGTASASVSVTVGAAPPSNPFHVGDLDGSRTSNKTQWTARVTIRIDDASHGPVSGVVVGGTWSTGGSGSCTTNRNGVCTVQSAKLSRASVASATFTVTSAARSGWTYVASANHDGDTPPDSSGTAITVPRP